MMTERTPGICMKCIVSTSESNRIAESEIVTIDTYLLVVLIIESEYSKQCMLFYLAQVKLQH